MLHCKPAKSIINNSRSDWVSKANTLVWAEPCARWAELKMLSFWAGGISSFPCCAREYRLLRRLVELKKRGLHFTGTIGANRLHGAPLKSEKELGKEGKRASCSTYESNHNLSLVRWLDNKCVTLISTYLGVSPESTVKRYIRSTKVHQDVSRPAIVGVYNSYMRGIDMFDVMCTLYKRQLKSKRWYLYVFYHTLTMIMVNSWFLYRREAKSLGVDNAMQMKDFQVKAAVSLISQGKVSRGRPSFNSPPPAKKPCVKLRPQENIRFDNVDNWSLSQEKRRRYRLFDLMDLCLGYAANVMSTCA